MTIEQYRAILARVTYKPGWSFELTPQHWPFLDLTVKACVLDSWEPSRQTVITMTYGFRAAMFQNEEEFMRFVRFAVGRTEHHEQNEWLKLDGKRYPTEDHGKF